MTEIAFAKGHGTENDFLIIEDYDAAVPLEPSQVAALCDRHAGIGADGVLRVVRAGALAKAGEIDAVPEGVDADDWFMDYRNADGTLAEMCGNGTRVFAHWLVAHDLVEEGTARPFTVGTRAGAKSVTVHDANESAASVTVEMGPATVTGLSTAIIGDHRIAGLGVDMGNPHLAAVIPNLDSDELATWRLDVPVIDEEFFPEGTNVEIVTPLDNGAVHMRVFERGVGETRSCGTGTVAAARSALADAGREDGRVVVHVPGGSVEVTIDGETSTLTGPSRIVASGTMQL